VALAITFRRVFHRRSLCRLTVPGLFRSSTSIRSDSRRLSGTGRARRVFSYSSGITREARNPDDVSWTDGSLIRSPNTQINFREQRIDRGSTTFCETAISRAAHSRESGEIHLSTQRTGFFRAFVFYRGRRTERKVS